MAQDLNPIEFTPVDASHPLDAPPRWDRIHDIPLTLSVELGTTSLSLHELAQLDQGHTIILDQFVGDTVLCRLNGVPVAKAEVAVQGDSYLIQIREVFTDVAPHSAIAEDHA